MLGADTRSSLFHPSLSVHRLIAVLTACRVCRRARDTTLALHCMLVLAVSWASRTQHTSQLRPPMLRGKQRPMLLRRGEAPAMVLTAAATPLMKMGSDRKFKRN